MKTYYNENDKRAAAWLRELIKARLLPDGDVDERDICNVKADEVDGYEQCHFFAGIGGWPYALSLAGWPVDRPVWTGSCPCQPFSTAGKGRGEQDTRHLWPQFQRLIAQCRPTTCFGEQVASKAGRDWLLGVRLDLEALGYAVGAADLCAASVGSPHIRQRLWWVADMQCERLERHGRHGDRGQESGRVDSQEAGSTAKDCNDSGLANMQVSERGGATDTTDTWRRTQEDRRSSIDSWTDRIWIPCGDGKARRIKPGVQPLAHGVPGRVGMLCGYGNAIVPQVAQIFIEAFLESEEQEHEHQGKV